VVSRLDRRRSLQLAAAALLGPVLDAARAGPYVDPAQADLPEPRFSFARQPWRSYLEVVPARTFLDGLGIVWSQSPPGRSDAAVAADLVAAGFRRLRLEVPWGALRWDEGGFETDAATRASSVLRACAAYGLRPLLLLNAHHGAPCPMRLSDRTLADGAARGSRRLRFRGGTPGIAAGVTTIPSLAVAGHAGPLVTAIDADGSVQLSRPVPRDLEGGAVLRVARLAYPPLHPVGSDDFERTAAGWLRYVERVLDLGMPIVGADLDVEMWNELSFGSDFLDVGAYYDPAPASGAPDVLRPGGAAWELARRTAERVRARAPTAGLIWGFSNTTFFHTPIAALPPGFDGQSYHPYGTGPRCYTRIVAGHERDNVGGFVPTGCAVQPEGWAHTYQQTETLVRLLRPEARAAQRRGGTDFHHFFTEHGFSPRELGIRDAATAERARAKFLLRAPLFWLNKGLAGLYVYADYDPDALSFGVLSAAGAAGPALAALARLVARFAGASAMPGPRPLGATVRRVAGPAPFYAGDPQGVFVSQEDRVALLPFQLDARRFVIGAYVMTEDFPADLAPQVYELSLDGLGRGTAAVRGYDPLDGQGISVEVRVADGARLAVRLPLTDTPRLLEVTLA